MTSIKTMIKDSEEREKKNLAARRAGSKKQVTREKYKKYMGKQT